MQKLTEFITGVWNISILSMIKNNVLFAEAGGKQ